MLNPEQLHRLRAQIGLAPRPSQFDGHRLQSVCLDGASATASHVPMSEQRHRGSFYPPQRIFGDPVDPSCLVGIAPTDLKAPARSVRRFANARVVGFDSVLREDNVLVSPANRWLKTPADMLAVNAHGHQGFLLEEVGGELTIHFVSRAVPRRIEMDAVFFQNVEPGNYGSFMFRQLPQMLFAREAALSCDCYITGDRTPWFQEAISLLRLPEKPVLTVAEVSGDAFRSIQVFDEPDCEGFLSPETRAGIAGLVDEIRSDGNPPEAGENLYVSRALSTSRRPLYRTMLNEAGVEDVVRGRGFRIVYPETLTLRDQIRCFSPAGRIIGPSGSGMLNAMFARPRARVADIETFTVTVRQHAKLYASCEFDYAFVFAPTEEADQRPMVHRAWTLPRHLLDQALDWLLAEQLG